VLRLRAAAAATVAIPLPPPDGWQAQALLRDGVAAPLADLEATPWASLTPGVRELVLRGVVQGDSAAFRFPLPPAALGVAAPGWRLEGLDGEHLRGDTLRLHREVASGSDRLLADPAPPFVRVERELALDLDWRLTTRVIRIAPLGGAINLEVPLLPGEAVMLDGRRSYFRATELDETLGARCAQMDVHPSGPLWGAGESPASGAAWAVEERALAQEAALCGLLAAQGLEQERRSLRLPVRALAWRTGNDGLTLEFELPRGAFATAVLHELLAGAWDAAGTVEE
jgi:hypothetical protein